MFKNFLVRSQLNQFVNIFYSVFMSIILKFLSSLKLTVNLHQGYGFFFWKWFWEKRAKKRSDLKIAILIFSIYFFSSYPGGFCFMDASKLPHDMELRISTIMPTFSHSQFTSCRWLAKQCVYTLYRLLEWQVFGWANVRIWWWYRMFRWYME